LLSGPVLEEKLLNNIIQHTQHPHGATHIEQEQHEHHEQHEQRKQEQQEQQEQQEHQSQQEQTRMTRATTRTNKSNKSNNKKNNQTTRTITRTRRHKTSGCPPIFLTSVLGSATRGGGRRKNEENIGAAICSAQPVRAEW
jgi:ATPase subunit of ABC transporter with duplicated ATPase domains